MRSIILSLLLLLFSAAAYPNVPLELPEPIVLPQYTDTAKVSKAILAALARRRWLAQSDTDRSITAQLDVRSHMLLIRIDYSPREIRFAYLDSRGMDYEVDDGVPYIHSSFSRWMRNLVKDIQIEIQRFQFERDPVEVVPVPPAMAARPDQAIGEQIGAIAPPTVQEPAQAAQPPPAPTAAPLASGQTVRLRAGAAVRTRPTPAGEALPVEPGTSFRLGSTVLNSSGTWWYLGAEGRSGWALDTDLEPVQP